MIQLLKSDAQSFGLLSRCCTDSGLIHFGQKWKHFVHLFMVPMKEDTLNCHFNEFFKYREQSHRRCNYKSGEKRRAHRCFTAESSETLQPLCLNRQKWLMQKYIIITSLQKTWIAIHTEYRVKVRDDARILWAESWWKWSWFMCSYCQRCILKFQFFLHWPSSTRHLKFSRVQA